MICMWADGKALWTPCGTLMAAAQVRWTLFLVFGLLACRCHGGCSEVDSLTEAVEGRGFTLGCISCKIREEVVARTTVDWHFKARGEDHFAHIFHYDHPSADVLHEAFRGRLDWLGTQSKDVQAGAIAINNVTFGDAGTYRCTFQRTLILPGYRPSVSVEKEVELSVTSVGNRETTAVISEIVMYVLIVVLQLWLIGVLLYCYKKTLDDANAREARKALKAQKEPLHAEVDCDGVQLE
ncbi:sodium channel regulatory subunit beta-1 [Nerophis lumbriciformis]|uniref:sodium channel regulatory subunit beta-1 n=1 Tax=Nerophis lumbriciformis TaxID=546530 RepID=UPI002AE09A8A|nr:sodium channel subunit beta-1-like [Nerophis lumbriciformis]